MVWRLRTCNILHNRQINKLFKLPSIDELPVPRGSWQAHHDAQQRRCNLALLFGVAFTTGTLVLAKASALVYLNYSPPKSLD